MQKSRLTLQRARAERREMVRQYVGSHWADEGSKQAVPVNLISLYCQIVARQMISKNPRVLLSVFDKKAKPSVRAMQGWCNREIEAQYLSMTLERVVIDAFFSVGICKVALATPADSALRGYNQLTGQAFAARVDLDDFVYDIHCKDFAEAGYIGHRYRAPLEIIKDSSLYSKARKELSPSANSPYNLDGDERIGVLGRGYYTQEEEFEDFVDLWEVYIPRKRLILTLADDGMTGATTIASREALREQEWLGPDCGPYHFLSYLTVPGNAMPKGPIQDVIDLHLQVNRHYRKLDNMASRIKENIFVRGGADADGKRVLDSNDGDILKVDSPEGIKQVIWGGPNPALLAFADHLKNLFDFMAGNLSIMGGLAPQSKTASQDRMLNENSARGVQAMQESTITFVSSVLKAMCWYWHHDPFKVMKTKYSPPGLPEFETVIAVHPAGTQSPDGQPLLTRDVKFEDLDIKVDPYSLQHQTPQERLAGLNQVVQQIIMPMMQLLQQAGIMFDVNTYLNKIAELMDMPDLQDIISTQEPPEVESAGPSHQAGMGVMPQETTRNYVRESTSNNTQGKEQAGLQALAGMGNGQMPSLNGEN